MAQINLSFDFNVSIEQRIGFQLAASIYELLFTDDTTINLHISATDELNNNQAVGGAVPIFHEVNYGVLQQYMALDNTSDEDASVLNALQMGNTVDFWLDGQLVDGNTTVMITRAQAKALGMEEALLLDDGSTWNRDVLDDPTAIDGYVVINNSYDWNYDFKRESEAPKGTLDFLTMALHELGHNIGFVSGLDGLIETFEMHSGELRTEGATILDLLRYSQASTTIDNSDGRVSDLSFGQTTYFSLDGGATTLAEFEKGTEYQASHWQRLQNALGIMDPTLGYQERTDLSYLDLQAFDVLGWDVNYDAYQAGIDLDALYAEAIASISEDFKIGTDAVEKAQTQSQDWYTLGHGSWWQAFKDQMIELGHGSWWYEFEKGLMVELGHGSWWQAFDDDILALGHGSWWQFFEAKVFELGHGSWWQQFEDSQFNLGHGSWWQQFEPQMLEQSFGHWWQVFEQQMMALGHGSWWQAFEAQLMQLGHGSWWQAFGDQILELGHGSWWQAFEHKVLELGHGSWWQEFEHSMLGLRHGSWWQVFELRHGSWWQQSDEFFLHLDEKLKHKGSSQFTQKLKEGHAKVGLVKGDKDDDIISGTQVQDRITGRGGDDLIDGAEGDDVIWGGGGHDILYGQDGSDVIYGGADDDLLLGEQGNDQLFGGNNADILLGGDGHDVLSGGEGRDDLSGGDGSDLLSGGRGDDLVNGEGDDDVVMGNEGSDRLSGGQGNDIVYGDQTLAEGQKGLAALLQQFLENQAKAQVSSSGSNIISSPTTDSNGVIRIEAESMNLSGEYQIEASSDASGGKRVEIDENSGTAQITFEGPAGSYMVIANYLDESDGKATATAKINGVVQDAWTFNQNDGQSHNRTIATNIYLNPGDTIEILGTRASGERARFDYLDFVSIENLFPTYVEADNSQEQWSEVPESISVEQSSDDETDLSDRSTVTDSTQPSGQSDGISPSQMGQHADIIEGGAGQDFLYGDDGNDILYGEVANVLEQRATGITNIGTFDGSKSTVIDHSDTMLLNQGMLMLTFQASDNVSSEQHLFSKDSSGNDDGGHLGVYIDSSRLHVRLQSNHNSYHLASSVLLNVNQSYDVAVTFGNRGMELWLDGQLVATDSYTGGLGHTSGSSGNREPIVLGASQDTSSDLVADHLEHYFAGTLQNVRLLDQQIDDTVIHQLHGGGTKNTFVAGGSTSAGQTPSASNEGVFDGNNTVRFEHMDTMLLNQGTLALRFQASNNVSSEQYLFSKDSSGNDDGGHLGVYIDNKRLRVRIQSANNSYYLKSNVLIRANQTYDVAVTFGDRGVELWLDGQLVDTSSYTGGLGHTSGGSGNREPILLGASQARSSDLTVDNLSDYFQGTIQNVRLFDQQLSSGDISQLPNGSTIAANTVFEGLMSTSSESGQSSTIGAIAQWPTTALTDVNTIFEAFTADSTHNDVLVGGDGNDTLYGNWGDDTLYGDNASGVEGTNDIDAQQIYNGSHYLLTDSVMTWTTAQAYAESMGGNLVTINSADEETWLQQTFGTGRFWIGLHDERIEGQFEWVSGEISDYTNFAANQPDNGGEEDYVEMNWGSNNRWNDHKADTTLRGVIEIKHEIGDDVLFGNAGNDVLHGEGGDDVLNGSSFQALGAYEKDVLVGGEGSDRFILGNTAQAFYLAAGSEDYALIKDFNTVEDTLQLHGASNYSQSQQDDNILLYQNGETPELIAVFENLDELDLATVAYFA